MQLTRIKWAVTNFQSHKQDMCSKCCTIFQTAKIFNGIEIGLLTFGLVGQLTTLKNVEAIASIVVKLLFTGLELYSIIKKHHISLIVFTCIRGLLILGSIAALIFL